MRLTVLQAASWSLPLWTTGPRNAGKALLYALNKIPGAESACAMKGFMSGKSGKSSNLWNISLYTKLPIYQLSQEITSR